MTGIVQGAGQKVMTWTPRETVGVETPPDKPGLSVIKQVDADEAEPGDMVTYTIRFRNMGNTPIRAVSIVDSLMPRLEYVAEVGRSARRAPSSPPARTTPARPSCAGTSPEPWRRASRATCRSRRSSDSRRVLVPPLCGGSPPPSAA